MGICMVKPVIRLVSGEKKAAGSGLLLLLDWRFRGGVCGCVSPVRVAGGALSVRIERL